MSLLVEKTGVGNFQIFISNPRQNIVLRPESEDRKRVFTRIAEYVRNNNVNLWVHAPYTINLSSKWDPKAWWNMSLIKQLELATSAGAQGVVVHVGRHMELSRGAAIGNMCANITTVVDMALKSPMVANSPTGMCSLLIETPAGQGTELGIELEEFGKIWQGLPIRVRKHMGICVDTCHIFSAGYDIRSKTGVKDWFRAFDHHIGLKNLKLVHLNDSKKPLGSHLDRHANMGDGHIGGNLGHIVRTIRKLKIPTVVETPGDLHRDIDLILSWISQKGGEKMHNNDMSRVVEI